MMVLELFSCIFNKELWELIYYIAFVVLTLVITYYTIRTFHFHAKKTSEIYCKFVESEPSGNYIMLCLEIFNYGNKIAKNISASVGEKTYAPIAYLKPNESTKICLGIVACYINALGDRLLDRIGDFHIPENRILIVKLNIDGIDQYYDVDVSKLYETNSLPDSIYEELEKISRCLSDIQRILDKKKY